MHFLGSSSIRATGREKKVPDDANCLCVGGDVHGLHGVHLQRRRAPMLFVYICPCLSDCDGMYFPIAYVRNTFMRSLGSYRLEISNYLFLCFVCVFFASQFCVFFASRI